MAEYHNQSKLRFWCQMVLPLVYDDSLSYMELLNKVVNYLNNCIQDVGNCETNIESLLEAFVNLQNYVNEIAEDISPLIEEKIDEMIESGEFGEILADALATVVAPEYDSNESYVPLNYAIKDGQLYCCTANTTGEWDSTKWRETTVGDELNTLMQRVFALNAGQVSFDESATYSSGTVGNKLKNLSANDIAYNSSETYNDATVGKELSNLNGAINAKISNLATLVTSVDQFRYASFEFETSGDVVLNPNISGAIIPNLSSGIFITRGNADGVIIGSTIGGALFAFNRNGSVWSAINLQLLTSALGLTETTFVASQNIRAGKIVFAKGYPLLATTDIPATTPLSTQTNVQSLPDGAINYLKELIDTETSNGTITNITTANTNFTINNATQQPSQYVTRGNTIEAHCVITCNNTVSGWQAIATLPNPYNFNTLYLPPWVSYADGSQPTFADTLFQNGTLYIRNAIAGKTYNTSFMYLI